ncbi:sugar O-acetyltransferase [Gemmatimonas sp.]|uniref:sugar O-acetyltransferase n=1 Tax=Gemmatimonas sp. TaxID=1962908 RepID=UPI0031C5CFFD|nr:sugar O-acetyltransferase [Gemmatimonas sp.]
MINTPESERSRMRAGLPYNTRNPELLALAHRARARLQQFQQTPSNAVVPRLQILRDLLGQIDEGVWIEAPFFCDYGAHISIGAHTFVNMNVVMLDAADITIGSKVLIGPGVQLLTISHPLGLADRLPADWTPGNGQSPYVTTASPIVVGDGAWIGAGSLVLPGVTIGAGAVIGAGSVVTSDVPPGMLAFGNPCRVQRAV